MEPVIRPPGHEWGAPIRPHSVCVTQARTVAATVRRLAEEAEGQKRHELRGLVIRAQDLARDLEAVLG